jgi:hypothetical protein
MCELCVEQPYDFHIQVNVYDYDASTNVIMEEDSHRYWK